MSPKRDPRASIKGWNIWLAISCNMAVEHKNLRYEEEEEEMVEEKKEIRKQI
jgi:hypothetical protein